MHATYTCRVGRSTGNRYGMLESHKLTVCFNTIRTDPKLLLITEVHERQVRMVGNVPRARHVGRLCIKRLKRRNLTRLSIKCVLIDRIEFFNTWHVQKSVVRGCQYTVGILLCHFVMTYPLTNHTVRLHLIHIKMPVVIRRRQEIPSSTIKTCIAC